MMTRLVACGTAGLISSPASDRAVSSPGNPPRIWVMAANASR